MCESRLETVSRRQLNVIAFVVGGIAAIGLIVDAWLQVTR
jgi:hypothetical protein